MNAFKLLNSFGILRSEGNRERDWYGSGSGSGKFIIQLRLLV
jgi:hypothetical protein